MIGRNTEQDGFHALVQAINEKLGPSNGIDSADVDENELQQLMQDYVSDQSEWNMYNFASDKIPYTRNVVDKGNGKSNLLILVWGPGKKSPIHDHANAHCIMKVLKGRLTETRFATPTDKDREDHRSMTKIRETTYSENQVTYMADTLGVHRISNPDPTDYAVSLHLYTPPNAAKEGCNVFNEDTSGVVHNSSCHFYSEYGVKVNRD
ncbi:cysteine dioxygenase [Stemphylium lycopersici]|uniref:Cysteine dioxygenase n=1 Tax=Stemphylium lycopersici TaxID=183478 RepID=A0A364N0W8_STELY|nr:cysteine dioxygenase [Stemphylium lycopersici]RAR03139.1 cysteine dioxygenase [Stemphylium lycopersici]RAR09136.1 cysteine dioxygenase [Stemphylium lycopersici]